MLVLWVLLKWNPIPAQEMANAEVGESEAFREQTFYTLSYLFMYLCIHIMI